MAPLFQDPCLFIMDCRGGGPPGRGQANMKESGIFKSTLMAPQPENGNITVLLEASRQGDADALDRLIELLYPMLRLMARGHLTRERAGHTLDATALAHEAVLRLFFRGDMPELRDRRHLLAAAGQQMRFILIDHARARLAARRDATGAPLPEHSAADLETILLFDRLLHDLAEQDPRAAQTVELRFFAGFSLEEIAAQTGLTRRTVQRDWEFARAWLQAALTLPARA